MEGYLTLKEAATALGISVDAIRNRVKRRGGMHAIGAVKVDGAWHLPDHVMGLDQSQRPVATTTALAALDASTMERLVAAIEAQNRLLTRVEGPAHFWSKQPVYKWRFRWRKSQ